VGDSVTFAGNGCPAQGAAGVALTAGSDGWSVQAKPAADGSWIVTATVPENALLGHRRAVASCLGSRFGEKFRYASAPIYVSTFRRLIVSPTTDVHPGSKVSIKESGGCPTNDPSIGTSAVVEIDKVPYITYVPGRYQRFAADAAGHWSGIYVIERDVRPGHFFLNAECPGYSREGTHAYYPSIPITVS
jgi:hypothetical protein